MTAGTYCVDVSAPGAAAKAAATQWLIDLLMLKGELECGDCMSPKVGCNFYRLYNGAQWGDATPSTNPVTGSVQYCIPVGPGNMRWRRGCSPCAIVGGGRLG